MESRKKKRGLKKIGGSAVGYVSLYRKWRPQSFDDVVGQDHIVKTLVNSLSSGRLSHAYLFSGPRGTGKTTVARLLAKGLNCQSGPTSVPCGVCSECVAITRGNSLNVVEIDGASNRGIDDVRELRGQVLFVPINANYKVYIVDEVHMLTPDAFNALLKTLEEPPSHVVFIFATTDPQKLPLTILSRVQRFDFQRFRETDLISRLETVIEGEQLMVHPGALELIARHAEGGMRDALGILEKCAAYADQITESSVAEVLGVAPQEQIFAFNSYLLQGQKTEALKLVDQLYNEGKDLLQFVRSVLANFRQEIVSDSQRGLEKKKLEAIQVFSEALREMRFALDSRIPLEVAVLRIILDSGTDQAVPVDLKQKVSALEKEITRLTREVKAAQVSPAGESAPEIIGPGQMVKPTKNNQEYSTYILANWEGYLESLRNDRLVQCEAFLREGTPLGVEDDVLIVAFPRDRGFHKASMEQDNHRQSAERTLSKFLGASFRLNCVFAYKSNGQREQAAAEEDDLSAEKQDRTEAKGSDREKLKSKEEAEFIAASKRVFGGEVFMRAKEKKSEDA